MTIIELSEDAAASVQQWVRGETSALSSLIDRTRAQRAKGPVGWRIPVTSRTVYCLPGLQATAAEEADTVSWEVTASLDPRGRAFFEDFLRYGPQRRSRRIHRRLSELATASREAADAVLHFFAPPRSRTTSAPPDSAVVIGIYGGDHAGDAAILGGVLLGLDARKGIGRASVLSHRPAHTARLVESLRVPVDVSVVDYRPGAADRLLDDAGLLILAGGPLTDLPRVLVRHFSAVQAARARGVPFVIERVGVGPFHRAASRALARRLAKMADAVSVRSSADARESLVADLAPSVGRDPAFDYLETRTVLDRADPVLCRGVDALIAGTEGRQRIGINVRPITHAIRYPRAAQQRFLLEFTDALATLAQQSATAVTYVFFPMNAVQFGMSDLDAAALIHKRLGRRADFRVWEADPDIDDILYLLRRMDCVVAMRYHAAIFALSQNLPVIGIDYPGAGGKVERLFHDLGQHADVCGMDAFTVAWFVSEANRLLTAPNAIESVRSIRPSVASTG